MSRYRLVPAPDQDVVLRQHCANARYVWNLAVEQQGGRTANPIPRSFQREMESPP